MMRSCRSGGRRDQLALARANGIIESMDLIPVFAAARAPVAGPRRPGDALDRDALVGCDGSPCRRAAIREGSQRAHHRFAHCADMIVPVRLTVSPFLNQRVFAEEHRADLIFFQVESNSKTSCETPAFRRTSLFPDRRCARCHRLRK